MPIRTGGPAPYAPPATVLQVVMALRDRGLTSPVTTDVLLRAGIPESLIPRTLRTLGGLEFIDEDGRLTPAMESLRRVPTAEFQSSLEEHVRAIYAEVFQFTEPAKDDAKRVSDAFRAYEPIGQRSRMVTLFLGLCEAAGIIKEGGARKGAAPNDAPPRRLANQKRNPERGKREQPAVTSAPNAPSSIHPAIGGLLQMLPAPEVGWTQSDRDRWFGLFGSVLDFAIPVRATRPHSSPDEDEDEDDDQE